MATPPPARPDSPLTWRGRPILTAPLAAARYGVGPSAVRTALMRGLRNPDTGQLVQAIDPPPLGERTPAYWQSELDPAWAARAGRGANLRGHG